ADDGLESSQADLSAALSSLAERELELENTKVALANSERAHHNSERACLDANRDRVLSRPHGKQEPLPVGGYPFFGLQRKAVDHTLGSFIAENLELDGHQEKGKLEEEMIAYVQQVFNTHTQENVSVAP
ncbi:hypothetical protein BGZ76_003403, partial [Entomortierella beljakovae]